MNVKLYINNRPGIYSQINNALSIVSRDTSWFMYFSGNDYCLCTKFRNELERCRDTGALVCYSNFVRRDERTGRQRTTKFPAYDYEKHLQGNFISDVSLAYWPVMKKYLPFNTKWGNYAFYDLWLRMYEGEGNVFCLNNNPEWVYSVRDSSKHQLRKKDEQEKAAYAELKRRMIQSHVN